MSSANQSSFNMRASDAPRFGCGTGALKGEGEAGGLEGRLVSESGTSAFGKAAVFFKKSAFGSVCPRALERVVCFLDVFLVTKANATAQMININIKSAEVESHFRREVIARKITLNDE